MTKADGGLRPLFFSNLPHVDWTPIESPITGGVPDANGCFNGDEFWIEMKATHTAQIRFRPLQPAWLNRRARMGGNVWIAVWHTPTFRPEISNLLLIHGYWAPEVKSHGMRIDSGIVASLYQGGPSEWPWRSVLNTLCSGRNYRPHRDVQLP